MWREKLNELKNSGSIWKHKLVTFEEFVESDRYCGHPKLSKAQYEVIYKLLGDDPEKIFTHERKKKVLILLVGKGGGKGTVSSLCMLYGAYILLSMKDCHSYFGFAKADPFSIVNVAMNDKQAQRFFVRFKNRLLENKWFRKYKLLEEGKYIPGTGTEYDEEINIKSSMIEMTKALQVLSLHSQQSKWEDVTIIMFVADEMSGFVSEKQQYNAAQIWDALRTSTRELPYIGIVTSFPRLSEDEDFTYRKYKEAIENPDSELIGALYPTFEFKPSRFYCGKTFKFVVDERTGETIDVPIELKEYAKDPEVFKARFLCIPGAGTVGDFFQYTEHLDRISVVDPVIVTVDTVHEIMGKKRIKKDILSIRSDSHLRVVSIDAGEKESEATLVLARRAKSIVDGRVVISVIVDGIVVWTPNLKESIMIDENNFVEIIFKIFEAFPNCMMVRMDAWNSAFLGARLEEKGIKYEVKNADYDVYAKGRLLIYSGGLSLPNVVEQAYDNEGNIVEVDRVRQFVLQCKMLKGKGMRKPRVQYGRQDLVDAVFQAVDVLLSDDIDDVDDVGAELIIPARSYESELKETEVRTFLFGNRPQSVMKRRSDSDEEDDWFVIV